MTENQNQGTEKKVEPIVTGELVFQFGNNEPIKIQEVSDNGTIGLQLISPPKKDNGLVQNPEGTVYEFRDGENIMKLYIKSV